MAPYKTRDELPDPIKEHLPASAQEIYKDAFNNAWERFLDPAKLKYGGDRESASHRVAWYAVKKKYEKNAKGDWVLKKVIKSK
jgi:cation transport regulator